MADFWFHEGTRAESRFCPLFNIVSLRPRFNRRGQQSCLTPTDTMLTVTLFACLAPIFKKDDYIKLKEEERIAKEEADKKKAEEAAKKAEEKKKKDEEKRLEAEKKAEEERLAEEAKKKAQFLPSISCSCFDVLFRPIEDKMDDFLGTTIDPFTGGWDPDTASEHRAT